MAKRMGEVTARQIEQKKRPSPLLRHSVELFIAEKRRLKRSPETVDWYERHLRLLFGNMLDRPMDHLNELGLRELLEVIQKKPAVSDITYNGYIRAAKAFIRWVNVWEDDSPYRDFRLQRIETIEVDDQIPDHLTDDEMARILATFDETKPYELRDKTLVMLLIDTGMRISEALNITLADIEGDLVTLHGTKSNKDRRVGINVQTRELLEKWLRVLDDDDPKGWVFPSRQGNFKHLSKRQADTIVKRAAARAGIRKRIYLHLFRHSYAVSGIRNGMNPEELRQSLGHSDITVSFRYFRQQAGTAIRASQAASPMSRIKDPGRKTNKWVHWQDDGKKK